MPPRLDIQRFDSCPEYNDWIDDQYVEFHGTLDILSYRPRPSFALFSLSPDTYQAAFGDFLSQWSEQLKQTVLDEFPSPIAHYFYRFENGYENDLQRLHFLRDTWEAIIDVIHAIAVSECIFKQVALVAPISFSDVFTDSVNQRLQTVERILLQASANSISLDCSQFVSVPILSKIRELNQNRNAFSHSSAQSEAQARTWIGECYEDVIDILDVVRGLANVHVFRYMGQTDATSLRVESFKGHSLTALYGTLQLLPSRSQCHSRIFKKTMFSLS